MSAVIFQGSAVKALKNELKFFTAGSLQFGTVDPSAVATAGDPSSFYHNTSSGLVYRKTDSGTTTNWVSISTAQANLNVTSKTANYTITVNDDLVLADSSGGTFTLTFPTPAGNTGKKITVKKTDSTLTEVSLSGTGITGDLMTQGEIREYVSDGSNWQLTKWDNQTDFITFTPSTTQGFGTITDNELMYRRVGDSIEIIGRFTLGTVTGSEARIGFPSGLTSDSAKVIAIQVAGHQSRTTTPSATVDQLLLVEPGVGYFTFGWESSTDTAFTKLTGSGNFNSTEIVTIKGSAPITGWNK